MIEKKKKKENLKTVTFDSFNCQQKVIDALKNFVSWLHSKEKKFKTLRFCYGISK